MVSYVLSLNSIHQGGKNYLFIENMVKINNQFMDLNRETAMRLWNKSFGKDTKVEDFAGRTMAKGAYNDRKSEFGWNVDHILPQSRGGVTADHNLVCCHIKTNDEKADKFPCFSANGESFEIIRVQNHYEIRSRDKKNKSNILYESSDPDFYDSASGIRFFKKLKGVKNKHKFVGTVIIKLWGLTDIAVVDFIEELMANDVFTIKYDRQPYLINKECLTIIARNNDLPFKEDISELLDKCVLLNTYLSKYFEPFDYIEGFDIYYRVDYFEDKFSMLKNIDDNSIRSNTMCMYRNSLFINSLVINNTEAGEEVTSKVNTVYTEYNHIKSNLAKNLNREATGR